MGKIGTKKSSLKIFPVNGCGQLSCLEEYLSLIHIQLQSLSIHFRNFVNTKNVFFSSFSQQQKKHALKKWKTVLQKKIKKLCMVDGFSTTKKKR